MTIFNSNQTEVVELNVSEAHQITAGGPIGEFFHQLGDLFDYLGL